MTAHQKRIVNGKVEIFKYTDEMKQVVKDMCATGKYQSEEFYQEICDQLAAQWPQWEFKPICVKDVIRRLGLRAAKRPAQKNLVDGKAEYFEFTDAMIRAVRRHYKTKSNREICEILKARWPQWDFKVASIVTLKTRLKIRRTQEQMANIIRRECASEAGKKRFEKLSAILTKHKIGSVYFCRRKGSYHGKLVIQVSRKKIQHYENYLYEAHVGKIPKYCDVILLDPYGPVIPENLILKPHSRSLIALMKNLDDRFVLSTLVPDKRSKDERLEFAQGPLTPLLIEMQRLQIQLLRAIKDAEHGRTTTNSANNPLDGIPSQDEG